MDLLVVDWRVLVDGGGVGPEDDLPQRHAHLRRQRAEVEAKPNARTQSVSEGEQSDASASRAPPRLSE
jgi:hypothetical protein